MEDDMKIWEEKMKKWDKRVNRIFLFALIVCVLSVLSIWLFRIGYYTIHPFAAIFLALLSFMTLILVLVARITTRKYYRKR